MKVVLLLSGGLDSTVLLYQLLAEGHEVVCLGFDYGQRHDRELNAANEICLKLGLDYQTSRISGLNGTLVGHFRDPLPPGGLVGATTVVPGRNLLFLSLAASLALRIGAEAVAIGTHQGDDFLYPDCRSAFLSSLEDLFVRTYGGPTLLRPFIHIDKQAIVELGKTLHVPFAKTWSCYRGATDPCGECGACLERAKALGTHKNQGMTFARLRKGKQ